MSKTPLSSGVPGCPPERLSGLLVLVAHDAEQDVLVLIGRADLTTAQGVGLQVGFLPGLLMDVSDLDTTDLAGLKALRDFAWPRDASAATAVRRRAGRARGPVSTGPSPLPRRDEPSERGRTEEPAARAPRRPAGQPSTPRVPLTVVTPPFVARSAGHPPEATLTGPVRAAAQAGPTGILVHAVPCSDTTNSAVCGARVRRARTVWEPGRPDVCTDCRDALAAESELTAGSGA